MANIILYNDQDQEQTLTGVSKLVARGPSGDVEFFVEGGESSQGDMLIYFESTPGINGKVVSSSGKRYNTSPATGYLTVDVPANVDILEVNPRGYMTVEVVNSETGNVETLKDLKNFTFEEVETANGTKRLQSQFSINWDGGTYMRLKLYQTAYVAIDGMYKGAAIAESNGKYILSGENATTFWNHMWVSNRYGYVNIYDLSKDASEPAKLAVSGGPAIEEMYFSSAGIAELSSVQTHLALYGCVNIKILDFSKCTAVQSFPYPLSEYADQYVNDYKVRVPTALYDEWIAAIGWRDIASHIVAV